VLRTAVKCTASGGILVIYDPEAVKASDGWFMRFSTPTLNKAVFSGFREDLLDLVERAGIVLQSVEDRMVSPGIVKRPYVARFNLFVGKPAAEA
jgi:hypothetical protein